MVSGVGGGGSGSVMMGSYPMGAVPSSLGSIRILCGGLGWQ
jgi:hypothetical protein